MYVHVHMYVIHNMIPPPRIAIHSVLAYFLATSIGISFNLFFNDTEENR